MKNNNYQIIKGNEYDLKFFSVQDGLHFQSKTTENFNKIIIPNKLKNFQDILEKETNL